MNTGNKILMNVELFVIFWGSEAILMLSVAVPIMLFLRYGWEVRKQEFTNQIFNSASDDKSDKLKQYFERYWRNASKVIYEKNKNNALEQKSDRERFDFLYDIMNGKKWYIWPYVLLLFSVFVFAGLAISTSMRAGHAEYIKNTLSGGIASKEYFSKDLPSALLVPFSFTDINIPAIAALGGAYLYIMTIIMRGYRARSLVASDIWWCCVRLVLAIPLGFAFGQVASSNVGVFLSFALGAFPTYVVIILLRRVFLTGINQSEKNNSNDEIIKLVGATPNVAAVLADEGADSIQQLACSDPISLALRSGLAASYVMYLVSQAHAWKLLGVYAQPALDGGICDAAFIKTALMMKSGAPAQPGDDVVLSSAGEKIIDEICASKNLDKSLLTERLKVVYHDPYTSFLCLFC